MKKSTFTSFLLAAIVLLTGSLSAQNSSRIWSKANLNETQSLTKSERYTQPSEYTLFRLNASMLSAALENAPLRGAQNSSIIIELPTDKGVLSSFKMFEAPSFEAALQARYPMIRSYVGQGIDDPSAIARISVGTNGYHVMISSGKHATTYVDPFTTDGGYYIQYSRKNVPSDPNGFECLVEEDMPRELNNAPLEGRNADDGLLRTYRLALASTGEYSQFHINRSGLPPTATDAEKKAAVLSAMNVTMTRVNGVFERDVNLTMIIVANNDLIIYLNAATDPFSNNNPGALINENIAVCNNNIGFANYDIGHVFSTGGGGIAQLNSPCTNNKARGVTGTNFPVGDPYDIDYVAHEMGHQYGGNHTQNNPCQRSGASVEPGSASTIMGYAGICAPNVQNNSDDYFNAVNIQEMWNNISVGIGSICPEETATNNAAPTADAGANFTIPKSTPFILRGVGTDPDADDLLTYCWEQQDAQPAAMPPMPTSTVGPAFRSIDPLPSPNRYMPALATVINGAISSTWEVVPSVARNMNFRLTVRDNVAGGASTASDNTLITVDGTAGPFVVTSQDTPVTWVENESETITWDVAGTDIAPVNSPNVDILLSLDGGVTFDTVLASNVPNDGSHDIVVPDITLPIAEARVMVAGSNHLFYQVNTTDIVITFSAGTAEFEFDNFTLYPNPTKGNFTLSFNTISEDFVAIQVFDLRGRLIDTKEFNNVPGTFSNTFDYSALNTGMYFVKIKNGDKEVTRKLIKQ